MVLVDYNNTEIMFIFNSSVPSQYYYNSTYHCKPPDIINNYRRSPSSTQIIQLILYILQLERTTPLSFLEGELFKADVTCDNEYGNGKLFFKYNGTRNLLEKGKQLASYLPTYINKSHNTTGYYNMMLHVLVF